MPVHFSPQERQLCAELGDLPRAFHYRYSEEAKTKLLEILFRALVNDHEPYLQGLFGENWKFRGRESDWSLRNAQGAVDGSEYTEAARGKPCGHIFKSGEATFRCKTCTLDETCVLCSRCFEASDHTGHSVSVSVSPGNSGCCDCGDLEAWRLPVNCAIHTAAAPTSDQKGKSSGSRLPGELRDSIRMTVGRVFDYICDVISCSPEQLRLPKSEASIREDEKRSRLKASCYGSCDEYETEPEFVLILWNDEKHAIDEVTSQVARACKTAKKFGHDKARETDDVGRSVVWYSRNLQELLDKAKIIEHIKITVTIRSARDTFREQMCSTMIEWLTDISGCSVLGDHNVLKHTICDEMLQPWRKGSEGKNASVGKDGLDDHEIDETNEASRMLGPGRRIQNITERDEITTITVIQTTAPDNDEDGEDDDEEGDNADGNAEDTMDIDIDMGDSDPDFEMRSAVDDELEAEEATLAGYPPPPPPPGHAQPVTQRARERDSTQISGNSPAGSDPDQTPRPPTFIPRTPYAHMRSKVTRPPPNYWLEKPQELHFSESMAENIRERLRLDWMILFDLRLWKKARVDLRDLYIGTVVTIPDFKRILGLRFAGLYTVLAQLYLIADREPDHSIIYLSLQMLTTPSITQEIIEKGNFLTNLIAILYTFLTTRQVGHPEEVSLKATLAFDAGSVTNRRMYHFFMDVKHLFQSEFVQDKLRTNDAYVLQYLDLIKLPQGICPNLRAIGEHVEYETDQWISASILTRELNRLCRQFAEAFKWKRGLDNSSICRVIRIFAAAAIINSTGAERKRFRQSEIKHEVRFKIMNEKTLDNGIRNAEDEGNYAIVDFVVAKEPISFHHALHYTLSWLIDSAKSMSAEELRNLLDFGKESLLETLPNVPHPSMIPELQPQTYLVTMFDFNLRVCAWLAQMKAGMWVRNGLSLRHQMSTYRGVAPRDVAYQRDIFLLQAAMVICDPTRMLLSIIDRFSMNDWMSGNLAATPQDFEEGQLIDVAEDFVHLLIIILSERTTLHTLEDEPDPQSLIIRREIIHTLCFKPLSFSELTSKLADKSSELDEFQEILDEMTVYKAPEGLNDCGSFELKPEYLIDLDPYIAHYSKNSRDEAEIVYRKWMSKKSGKPVDEVVLEPRLRPIKSGIFSNLPAFTGTRLFCQIIYYLLQWAVKAGQNFPNVQSTRVENFLSVVLHLVLIAVLEDQHQEQSARDPSTSFVCQMFGKGDSGNDSIFLTLHEITKRDTFQSCHAKAKLVLLRAQQTAPQTFARATMFHDISIDRFGTDSPASISLEEVEAKKKLALERKAKVLAQFAKQQQDFVSNQAFDWGEEDFEDSDDMNMAQEEHKQLWKYPSGNCILCQEETNDGSYYGTFALLSSSKILRQTDVDDFDVVKEVVDLPQSLDRSTDSIRPFGVSGSNRSQVRKLTSTGLEVMSERQGLGKGFDQKNTRVGPISVGCGHIMHYPCFETYCQSTTRRQNHQIARNHPERLELQEFVCPLCKALGNAFLPIIWKGKLESFPGVLSSETPFDTWIENGIGLSVSRFHKSAPEHGLNTPRQQEIFMNNIKDTLPSSTISIIQRMSTDSGPTSPLRTSMASMPGVMLDEASPDDPTTDERFEYARLLSIYTKLRDTIRKNVLPSQFKYEHLHRNDELSNNDVLASALGFSISATEIAQRGIESEPGNTLIDKIPSLNLTHLRILSETAASYISIGGLRQSGKNKTSDEFSSLLKDQLAQIFGGHQQIFDEPPWSKTTPLLSLDPFIFLTEASFFLVPTFHIELIHMVRLCYTAEIVKVLLCVYCTNLSTHLPKLPVPAYRVETSNETLQEFQKFLEFLEITSELANRLSGMDREILIKAYSIVCAYATVFLRKVAIFLHVSHGVDFPNTGYSDMQEPELDRLTKVLRLPPLAQIFKDITSPKSGLDRPELQSVVVGWVHHWRHKIAESDTSRDRHLSQLRPVHPGIYELIGLPKFFDTLIDEVMRRRCPTTKKDLVEPAICLFCGAIFCSQAVCCSRENLGGCNQHMRKCGGNIGIFISLRKCMVLFLHNGNGSWAYAPYLDKHGEVDPSLRRNRQLFLNQKRYDALLRNVWLNHMVPTTISRKLEADINNGGWETL